MYDYTLLGFNGYKMNQTVVILGDVAPISRENIGGGGGGGNEVVLTALHGVSSSHPPASCPQAMMEDWAALVIELA